MVDSIVHPSYHEVESVEAWGPYQGRRGGRRAWEVDPARPRVQGEGERVVPERAGSTYHDKMKAATITHSDGSTNSSAAEMVPALGPRSIDEALVIYAIVKASNDQVHSIECWAGSEAWGGRTET